MACHHSFDDRNTSVFIVGLCPLCQRAELERYRIALSWIEDQDPQLVDAAKEKFGFKK